MRLFLALVPPDELRGRLGELADVAHARCGGRRMPDESLHLTLAFLGEVEEAKTGELIDWVCGLAAPPGRWRLDAWGHFHRPGIVWVGGTAADPDLAALHQRLWNDLEALGHRGRPTRFVPHVTLLRRARRLATEVLPDIRLDWAYHQIELIHSSVDRHGARYASLARSRSS
ncbi:RNA 2',3'-cyclic phosphodiesterase [Halomonas campisalis]|uniref:RNA 2',3'-cyclic phosphodiesterase n=1 Tax=Billgrantia campisalis TaxID=74661 RepID=A0ABS9P4C1_9GAMM|nr:RNA 2',3'-cyclic phosphodiesterase [Halomonas campisalis]MCG6656641.1 RNA 2',3'-cyclic phosphodiesterase [Halomonas campisalis]MDR5861829.1 RNA 2',3'-cyclic phosphodiesterase [Halomonas campisalis]